MSDRETLELHLDQCEACDELVAVLAQLEIPGPTLRQWLDELDGPSREGRVGMGLRVIDAVVAGHHRGELIRTLAIDHTSIVGDELTLGGSGLFAPEQLGGEPGSRQTDQYVVALVCWELLVGVTPYRGATPGALAVAMTLPPTVPVGHPEHPRLAVLARALHPDPARRWPSVEHLRRVWVMPPRPRRIWIWLLVTATLAIGLASRLL